MSLSVNELIEMAIKTNNKELLTRLQQDGKKQIKASLEKKKPL